MPGATHHPLRGARDLLLNGGCKESMSCSSRTHASRSCAHSTASTESANPTIVRIRERESPPEPPTRPVDPAPAGLALVVDEPSAQGEPAPRRLRAARLREKGWSNKQIAAELAVHPSTIGRWFTAADADHPETDENTQEDPS